MATFLLIAAMSLLFAALAFLPEEWGSRAAHPLWRRARRPLFLALAHLSVAVFFWRMTFKFFPEIEARWMPVAGYALVERDVWLPAILLFPASLAHLLPSRLRPAATLPLLIFLGLVLHAASWRLDVPTRPLPSRFSEGVCLQTTGYTCAAASAATLLHAMGIESSEDEMARLASAHPKMGTSCYLAALALQRKLDEAGGSGRAVVVAPGTDGLDALPAPFLAAMQYSPFLNHMVCVLRVSGARILVGDPIGGLSEWPRKEFERRWRGVAVVVER